jgi:hypothetical protein
MGEDPNQNTTMVMDIVHFPSASMLGIQNVNIRRTARFKR